MIQDQNPSPSLEGHIAHHNTRELQWWVAAGVGILISTGGAAGNELAIAGAGLGGYFLCGGLAIAHRVGADERSEEKEKQSGK